MKRRLACMAALFLAVTVLATVAHSPPATAASNCVEAEEATAAGDDESGGGEDEEGDEDAPPKFSRAFFRRSVRIEASLDGFEEKALPISIEEVCRVPRKLRSEAAQLAGNEGIAVAKSSTRIVKDRRLLAEPERTDELGGADTATLTVRLLPPARWRADEDGDAVPTFRAYRIAITD